MKNHLLFFTLFVSLFLGSAFISSCKSTKTEKGSFELKYSKSACRGTCPNFDLTIKDDQTVIFNGREHTIIKGIVQTKLADNAYQALQELLEESDFLETEVVEEVKAFDISVTTLEVTKGNQNKKQNYYMTRPEKIQPLIEYLEKLALKVQSETDTKN